MDIRRAYHRFQLGRRSEADRYVVAIMGLIGTHIIYVRRAAGQNKGRGVAGPWERQASRFPTVYQARRHIDGLVPITDPMLEYKIAEMGCDGPMDLIQTVMLFGKTTYWVEVATRYLVSKRYPRKGKDETQQDESQATGQTGQG